MSELPDSPSIVTPSAIVTAILGFFAGAASLAYNPFFATTVIAVALSILTLRSAAKVEHHIVQGLLRIAAVLGIMSGLGGVMVLLFPGLGVRAG
jgi:predicted PurR-regulated permease PerM